MSLMLVQFMVTEPRGLDREREARLAEGLKVDWIGFLLVALSLGCLEMVLDKGQARRLVRIGFHPLLRCVSVVSLSLFIPWELSRKRPIVDIRLFGHRQFARPLPDDARGRRPPVQHDAAHSAAAADRLRLHRDAVGPGLDAGRLRHAD